MRKLVLAALSAAVATGITFAGAASAAPTHAASTQTPATCVVWTNPTVEYVWSHVCHF